MAYLSTDRTVGIKLFYYKTNCFSNYFTCIYKLEQCKLTDAKLEKVVNVGDGHDDHDERCREAGTVVGSRLLIFVAGSSRRLLLLLAAGIGTRDDPLPS